MICITAESCHSFSLGEILIMAAMNVETARLASGGRVRSVCGKAKRIFLC